MVYIKSYEAPPFDTREILRYAGVRSAAPDMLALLEDCLAEVNGKLTYKACWQIFPIQKGPETWNLTFTETASASLQKHLRGCDRIAVFAATVGLELDRLIARYGRTSPAKALMLQAIGAERIEALCDLVCLDLAGIAGENGRQTASRFSPGYGDLPLEMQKDIFRVLDCPRKIGLSLNESLLMSPSKSVTALVGMGEADCEQASGCKTCDKQNCSFRGTK